jgi:subtilisin family serine protease
MRKTRVVSGLLVWLLMLSMGATGSASEAAQATDASPQVSSLLDNIVPYTAEGASEISTVDSLLAKTSESGSVLVLAELALPAPFTAEAESGAQAVLDQRAAIAAATAAVLAALEGTEAQPAATFTTIPYLALRVDAKALLILASLPEVASIEEDVPAAPALASSTQLIGLPAAWASGVEGNGQTVVILDTGIDTDHSFFASRLVDGACFSNANGAGGYTSACPGGGVTQYGVVAAESDTSNPACWNGASSLCAHGTHVAGIAAGGDDNTFDGVARKANIIAIQVFTRFDNYANCGGSGTCMLSYTSDQLRALEYVYTTLRPARAVASVNMSLGAGQYITACDTDSRKAAIDNLRGVGIATVIAAGNNHFRNALTAPACISTAVAVGGVTDTDNPPANAVVLNMHSLVDLLAPAYSIVSSYVGGGYASMSGTSMAAPHVAGAFALCKSANPALSVNQVEAILEQTGAAIRDARSGGVHTKPRLQMDAAAAACQQVSVWTGAANTSWSNAANWSGGTPPGATSFANIPSSPAGGRFPAVNGSAELRSLTLEPGAQINITGATLTLHGSLELSGAAQISSNNSTVVLTGSQLATIALPANQRLRHLQVGSGGDAFHAALESNLAINGNLTIQPGATLDLAVSNLTVEGTVTNRGTLRQTQNAATGVVEFLRIKNAAGSDTRYYGVDIAPQGSMGNTLVAVSGDQTCGAGGTEVRRCFDVTPTTASPSNITFYYNPEEANGANSPASYHWNGTIWEGPLAGTCGTCGPALFVTAQGVNAYSTFAVRDSNPLAVTLAGFDAQAHPEYVLLLWETASEIDNLGFAVLRSTELGVEPTVMAFVPSLSPGSTQGNSYTWQDRKVEVGHTYYYWLEDIDVTGVATRHGPVSVVYELTKP